MTSKTLCLAWASGESKGCYRVYLGIDFLLVPFKQGLVKDLNNIRLDYGGTIRGELTSETFLLMACPLMMKRGEERRGEKR